MDCLAQSHAEVRAAATGVLSLWDRLIELATHVEPADLPRTTPCPDTDVDELLRHVAGAHQGAPGLGAGPTAPVARLRAAREAQARQIEALVAADQSPSGAPGSTNQRRVLRAHCLDLWVHSYDLSTALGRQVDLDDDSPGLTEACRYLLEHTPRLFAVRCADGQAVRVTLRGSVQHDATLASDGAPERWVPDDVAHTVTSKPGAFVLLLSGRGDPEHWHDLGALTWSGASGEAFVRKARLFV